MVFQEKLRVENVVLKAYLDSNILISYFWSHYFGHDKPQDTNWKLINRAINGEYDVCASTFSTIEIFEHFRDYFLLTKVIKQGHGYREFKRWRGNHVLHKKQKQKIYGFLDDFEAVCTFWAI